MNWVEMFFQDWQGLARTAVVGALAYVTLVLFLRISGKRTLAKLNAFDLVVTVALGSTLSAILLQESIALTEGALALGLLIAMLIVWLTQEQGTLLAERTFRMAVLFSLVPAVLAVVVLAWGARDVPIRTRRALPHVRLRGMGKPFLCFLAIVGVFELGNSSDAFLVLRAQDAGLSVLGVMGVLAAFNFVYALLSTPAGALSDCIGRKRVIVVGWLLYTLTYAGFALARSAPQVLLLYLLYGVYYALSHGTTRALVADLVPADLRGTAFGTYNAVIGLLDLPASLIAGLLWQGAGKWQGFGPGAPFWFGAAAAGVATLALVLWQPHLSTSFPVETPK